MKTLISAAALTLLAGTAAFAQTATPMSPGTSAHETTAMAPSGAATFMQPNGTTVTNYYKQNVYDPSDNKIGEIVDVLVDKSGHVTTLVVSVGGFLGIGNKDVAAPFQSVQMTSKNNKAYLVMNTTKDALKTAPGYTYDKNTTTWMPAKS